MDENKRLETLKEYMLNEFGITPENIDSKLEELKKKFNKKAKRLDPVERGWEVEKDKVI